jgi:hypothetical protein
LTEESRFSPRKQAELIAGMTKAAQKIERTLNVEAAIVVCIVKDENGQIRIQDAGRFPKLMSPQQFYQFMIDAHTNGQLGQPPRQRIIKPN